MINFFSDLLIKHLYENHNEFWLKIGSPYGIYFKPKKSSWIGFHKFSCKYLLKKGFHDHIKECSTSQKLFKTVFFLEKLFQLGALILMVSILF